MSVLTGFAEKKKQKKAFVFLFLYREATSFVSFKVGEI
jgi:hypothetical protein